MRERVSERERSLPHCNHRVVKEGDKRSLPLCFPIFLYLPLIVIFCSLWAAVVFPTFGFSTLTFCVHSLAYFIFCFLCIMGQLGCGRVKRSESNRIPVTSIPLSHTSPLHRYLRHSQILTSLLCLAPPTLPPHLRLRLAPQASRYD